MDWRRAISRNRASVRLSSLQLRCCSSVNASHRALSIKEIILDPLQCFDANGYMFVEVYAELLRASLNVLAIHCSGEA